MHLCQLEAYAAVAAYTRHAQLRDRLQRTVWPAFFTAMLSCSSSLLRMQSRYVCTAPAPVLAVWPSVTDHVAVSEGTPVLLLLLLLPCMPGLPWDNPVPQPVQGQRVDASRAVPLHCCSQASCSNHQLRVGGEKNASVAAAVTELLL
jgi:hypothetical protein